jgi:hypothetical protein
VGMRGGVSTFEVDWDSEEAPDLSKPPLNLVLYLHVYIYTYIYIYTWRYIYMDIYIHSVSPQLVILCFK